jgi:cation diffusion facilitator family transporter
MAGARPIPNRIVLGSVAISAVVLALKYAAYRLTGSVALFSDALESIINVATAIMALIAIRYSALPADANHPYGHTKAEYFSVVVEGVLIIVAALAIFREAYLELSNPIVLTSPAEGLIVNGIGGLINAGWCLVLIRVGRRSRSPALVADGKHLLADVLTSAGVIIGLVLALVTGWTILDPILAAVVALNILWWGWSLVRESVGGLMDEAVPQDVLDKIRTVIAASATGALEAHDVRTRQAGRLTFVEFHLVVPGTMSVAEAHAICDDIERALRAAIEDVRVTIHVEPPEKAKHHGVVVVT